LKLVVAVWEDAARLNSSHPGLRAQRNDQRSRLKERKSTRFYGPGTVSARGSRRGTSIRAKRLSDNIRVLAISVLVGQRLMFRTCYREQTRERRPGRFSLRYWCVWISCVFLSKLCAGRRARIVGLGR